MKNKFIRGQFYMTNVDEKTYDILSAQMIDKANQYQVALETWQEENGNMGVEYYIKKPTLTLCKEILKDIQRLSGRYKIHFLFEFKGEK